MAETRRGCVAVIFINRRNRDDEAGYAAAAQAMGKQAALQPGYVGIDSVRDADGNGITVSYWTDEAAALAWRREEGHSAIREKGRASWYDHYDVIVTCVTRAYRWSKRAGPGDLR